MRLVRHLVSAAVLAAPIATILGACIPSEYDGDSIKSDGKGDTSLFGVFLDATFDGRLVTEASTDDQRTIRDQLFYTVGQLNGFTAVGRIDKAEITNIQKTT